ncbi:MAG TPA: type II CAAX endopeptidase family protein [Thermoanaerobaculia bacterium]|jgi:membrane protease YdiL (CAAX protease family)
MAFAFSTGFALLVWLTIVVLNERYALLRCDHFPSTAAKWLAYFWLGGLLLGLALMVTASALTPTTPEMMEGTPFYALFVIHAVLMVFLCGWWLLSGRPPLREFLNIRHERPAEVAAIGMAVGVGGWVVTILSALLIALLLQGIGAIEGAPEPPAMIGWMANLALWKKALIILSAMTVEEFFFRSFLQKRIGLVASTILFSLAHFTYGNPLLLIGITVVSLIIGITFYRTRNVIPGIIAHGVFDAIQLFVIVPFAVKMMSAGA